MGVMMSSPFLPKRRGLEDFLLFYEAGPDPPIIV